MFVGIYSSCSFVSFDRDDTLVYRGLVWSTDKAGASCSGPILGELLVNRGLNEFASVAYKIRPRPWPRPCHGYKKTRFLMNMNCTV
jgi:hypothetical protein